jgi:hypothetical protein
MKIRYDALLFLLTLIPSTVDARVFHTPARRFGSAYSVKMTIWRDSFSYVIPVWIRPDRAESSLDPGQMRLIGWPYQDFKADEVEISGVTIPLRNFKSERSDLAVSPEFAKNCCMGVIGRDILEKYRLIFRPESPTHIQWEPLHLADAPPAPKMQGLGALFSVNSPKVRWSGKSLDASRQGWVLDLRSGQVSFFPETAVPQPVTLRDPLLTFDFLPGSRNLRVRALMASEVRDAASVGLKSGSVVTELNGQSVSSLDRYEIVELLLGRKTGKLQIAFLSNPLKEEKSKVVFDFSNHAFIQTQPVPTPAGRDKNP